MPENVAKKRAIATLAYENAGREITQAFGTLNSNLTLAAGALGALLTVLGAGELFGHDIIVQIASRAVKNAGSARASTLAGVPRLSNVSVLLLAAAFPLLGRFFIRATFGYQQLLRFNKVQRCMWDYLNDKVEWTLPSQVMELYVQKWKSPASAGSLFWGSFKYGFVWVFVLALIALMWGLATAPGIVPRVIAGIFAVVSVGGESLGFRNSKYLQRPAAVECKAIEEKWPTT
jgi:hypothetical protein